MKKVKDIIDIIEDNLFVGRVSEIELLKRTLLDTTAPWQLLHIYGMPGIGKTSLLQAFIRKNHDFEFLYFDCLEGSFTANEFLIHLRAMLIEKGCFNQGISDQNQSEKLLECLNELAVQKKLIVLFFDSYKQGTHLDHWFFEEWYPKLVPHVRICSAGQFPIANGKISASGWKGLIHNVQIQPLNKDEVTMYTKLKGIDNQQIQNEIEWFSGGIPLAVSMACDAVRQQGSDKWLDDLQKRKVIGSIIEIVLQKMGNESLHRLLEPTCLLWQFDQDILSAITNERISNEAFREFCRLSLISESNRGWILQDTVRKWIRVDLSYRAPERYENLRNRALKELRRREIIAAGQKKIHYAIEKLYLHENDWLHSYLFNSHGDKVSIRPMTMEDVPQVEEIYRMWTLSTPPYIPDDSHQERFIVPLLELEPLAFWTVWYNKKLIAFHSFVPLNEATKHVFQQNSVFSKFLNQKKWKGNEYVAWIGGIIPDHERIALGLQLRHLFNLFTNAHQIIGIGQSTALQEVLQSMGFERIPWADYVSQDGAIHWYALQLDLSDSDFFARLDKIMDSTAGHQPFALEDIENFVKKALIYFDSLEQHDDILVMAQKLFHYQADVMEEGPLAVMIQKLLLASIDEMGAEKQEEKVLAKILQLAYIQKIGSHEVIANHLALSISTYYRYLKKAMKKIALTICRRCPVDLLFS